MRLNYDGKTLGKITSNHSMSIEDCIELLEIDEDVYDEIELFSIDFLDEYGDKEITAIYEGKEWSELSAAEKDYFLHLVQVSEKEGDCIVDFEGLEISIPGRLILNEEEDELKIEDEAVFYNPIK